MDAQAPCWLQTPRANISVHRVNAGALPETLARDISQRLNASIQARGLAVLCVSGGKSPIALFEALRVQAVDWSRVRVTLADERCVPTQHPGSNALLVQQHLLQGPAAAAQWVGLVNASQAPLALPVELAALADAAMVAAGRADVLILGMGVDGHTASLFPDDPNLRDALDLKTTRSCVAVELPDPPAEAPYPRITQTLARLLTARHIVLPLAGADKLLTLGKAWAAPSLLYPVSFVLHQTQTPVALWITP